MHMLCSGSAPAVELFCPYLTISVTQAFSAAARRGSRLWSSGELISLCFCRMADGRDTEDDVTVSCRDERLGAMRQVSGQPAAVASGRGLPAVTHTRGSHAAARLWGRGRLGFNKLIFWGFLLGGWFAVCQKWDFMSASQSRNITFGVLVLAAMHYLRFKYHQVKVWKYIYNKLQTSELQNPFLQAHSPPIPHPQQLIYSRQRPIQNISVPFLLYFLSQMFSWAFLGSVSRG